MSKEFYSIAFKNVSGKNILQNRIPLKTVYTMQNLMDVNFWAKGKHLLQRLQTKIEICLLRTRKIGAPKKLSKNWLSRLFLNIIKPLLWQNIYFHMFDPNSNISDSRATINVRAEKKLLGNVFYIKQKILFGIFNFH